MADDPRTKLSPTPPPTMIEPPQLDMPLIPAGARRTRSGQLVVDDTADLFLRYLIAQDDPLKEPRDSFRFAKAERRLR